MARVLPRPYRRLPPAFPGSECWQLGECSVIVTRETGHWHISVAHPRRYPTWDEIKEARYKWVPNEVTMAMLLPPREEYVNVHPNCFHLYEIDPGKGVIR